MFQKISEKMTATRVILLTVVLAMAALLVLSASIARAQGETQVYGQAFGTYHPSSQPRAVGAYIWTGPANPPNVGLFTASPLAICRTNPQCSELIETGWVKGPLVGGNVIRPYVSFTDIDGQNKTYIITGYPLTENTWYRFRLVYYKSHQKWEIKLTGPEVNQWIWRQPHPLGWDRGNYVKGGSETYYDGDWMDVWAWHPEYRTWDGSWTLWNYSDNNPPPYTSPHGHIEHAYDFGWHAWGP